MRRTMVLAGLCVALVVPAQALSSGGSSASTAGHAKRGMTITFSAVFKGNKPKKIKDFTFEDLPGTCDEGAELVDGGPLDTMRVNSDKEFKGTFPAGADAKTKVTGEYLGHDKFKGTLRNHGDYLPTLHNCDTGKAHWTAET